jgi:hypothetical protein
LVRSHIMSWRARLALSSAVRIWAFAAASCRCSSSTVSRAARGAWYREVRWPTKALPTVCCWWRGRLHLVSDGRSAGRAGQELAGPRCAVAALAGLGAAAASVFVAAPGASQAAADGGLSSREDAEASSSDMRECGVQSGDGSDLRVCDGVSKGVAHGQAGDSTLLPDSWMRDCLSWRTQGATRQTGALRAQLDRLAHSGRN